MAAKRDFLAHFFALNRRASSAMFSLFDHTQDSLLKCYPAIVEAYINGFSHAVVIDAGGGANCIFANPRRESQIIALDCSRDALSGNRHVDATVLSDITQPWPFPGDSADVVTSFTVLEHLRAVPAYVREAHRVLRPGGLFINLFPNRWAPFAVINRILPQNVSRALLFALKEVDQDNSGLPAFYNYCSPRQFARLARATGFHISEIRVSYFQSDYYAFFAPLCLFSLCYEWLLRCLRMKAWAAYILVVAEKPQRGSPEDSGGSTLQEVPSTSG